MKTFTRIFSLILAITLAALSSNAQQQIPFVGYVSQGEGIAGWNADGSGPEPAATGHLVPAPGFTNQVYYGSSHDYISGNPDHACFHFLNGMTGFPSFEQALTDHGFTPEQVKCKYELTTLGDDLEGIDWFFMNNWAYCNYYDIRFIFELNGEPMLSGFFNYGNMYINTLGGNWHIETAYTPLKNVAQPQTPAFEIAQAFLDDLDGKEIRMLHQANFGQSFSGNGRSGAYYNVFNGKLESGYPQIPCLGLTADNQGSAAWDADGTGPEPYGNGHQTMLYYAASVDYDGINPHPEACLAHFLEGSTGFFNTMLQLQYRGFEIGDMKIKMGLASFGPDVEGEDWGIENGLHWVHEYNNVFTIEINGEPILYMMQDTMKMVYHNSYWKLKTSVGKAYDISQNASPEAQFVAKSFLRDLGTHYLEWNITNLNYTGSFSGNGRNGAFYQISEGAMTGVHKQATFVSAGEVSGIWTAEDSPYYVDGHLEIANGQTLTIEPGAKVAVRGPYHFNVQGCIKAQGTADENIVFTRSNPNLWWDGFDYDATPTTNETSVFDYCLFEYGYGQGTGIGFNSGGMFAIKQFDSVYISNSIFRYNKVDREGFYPPSGGAIGLWNADIIVSKCTFYGNVAKYGGAFFTYYHAQPIISNCLFYENHAIHGGAFTFYDHSNGILINNTIADNTANYGGALYFYWISNPEIINNIIWGNTASISGNQVYSASLTSGPGFYYNNIEGGQAGFGGSQINGDYLFNLDQDPDFETNPDFPPYSLKTTSSCIDMGTPDTSAWYYPQYLPATCLCGNPRTVGSCIDIGAYENLFTGINEKHTEAQALQLFPNPAQHETAIHFSMQNNAWVTIEIFNCTGTKVETILEGTMPAGDQILRYPTIRLKPGIYFCVLKTGDQVITQKLIKQ